MFVLVIPMCNGRLGAGLIGERKGKGTQKRKSKGELSLKYLGLPKKYLLKGKSILFYYNAIYGTSIHSSQVAQVCPIALRRKKEDKYVNVL